MKRPDVIYIKKRPEGCYSQACLCYTASHLCEAGPVEKYVHISAIKDYWHENYDKAEEAAMKVANEGDPWAGTYDDGQKKEEPEEE